MTTILFLLSFCLFDGTSIWHISRGPASSSPLVDCSLYFSLFHHDRVLLFRLGLRNRLPPPARSDDETSFSSFEFFSPQPHIFIFSRPSNPRPWTPSFFPPPSHISLKRRHDVLYPSATNRSINLLANPSLSWRPLRKTRSRGIFPTTSHSFSSLFFFSQMSFLFLS